MLKKIMFALGVLGLSSCAATQPAAAHTTFSFGIYTGSPYYSRYDNPYYGRDENRYYYNRTNPCPRQDILVQDRRGHLYCMNKREYYNQYNGYNQYNQYNRTYNDYYNRRGYDRDDD